MDAPYFLAYVPSLAGTVIRTARNLREDGALFRGRTAEPCMRHSSQRSHRKRIHLARSLSVLLLSFPSLSHPLSASYLLRLSLRDRSPSLSATSCSRRVRARRDRPAGDGGHQTPHLRHFDPSLSTPRDYRSPR